MIKMNGDGKKVSPIQVQKSLKGTHYPADKEALIRRAQENGADENIMNALKKIPNQSYKKPVDVSRAVGQIE